MSGLVGRTDLSMTFEQDRKALIQRVEQFAGTGNGISGQRSMTVHPSVLRQMWRRGLILLPNPGHG